MVGRRRARTADGWTAEIEIPFKTLRFEAGDAATWGINFSRRIRRKNEISYWSPVPRAYTIYRASSDGRPRRASRRCAPGRNLRIKPFVLGGAVRGTAQRTSTRDTSVGVDVKAGAHAVADARLTVNPDFAQAEADEQQVNLTQFSLFYPEKREFFLENSGIFYFGDIPRNHRQTSRFRPPRGGPAALLQPPHRPQRSGDAGAALRRRAPHRPRRQVRRRAS